MSGENGGGFDFKTMVSVAAFIAAAAAIYYASSVDASDKIQALEGTIKSLSAKLNDRPTEDGVKLLINETVKIPPPGTSAEQVQSMIAEPLGQVRETIAALPDEAKVRALTLPKGAVVAFAMSCPTQLGWKVHEGSRGRFLVAAGPHKDKNGTARNFVLGTGTDDGEYEHTLSVEEMPAHRHAVDRQGPTRGIEGLPPIGTDGAVIAVIEQELSLRAGGGKAHNNVPPYIALHFCEKT